MPRGRTAVKLDQLPSKELRDLVREFKGGYYVERTGGGHYRVRDRNDQLVAHDGTNITLTGNPDGNALRRMREALTEARVLKGTEPKRPYTPPEGVQARIDAYRRMTEERDARRVEEARALRERLTGLLSFMQHDADDVGGLAEDLARVGHRIAIEQGKEGMTPDLLGGSVRRVLGGSWIEPRYQEVWNGLCQRLEDAPDKVGAWYGYVRETRGLSADAVRTRPIKGEWPFRVELLSLDVLLIDDEYQRPVSWTFVRREAARFDPALVGTIDVAQRAPNRYAILDGQQRTEIVRLVGKASIYCSIYVGLDLASEARFFLHKNRDRKSVHPYYTFKAKLTSQDADAIAVDEIVTRHGYRLAIGAPSATASDTNIAAIAAVESAYTRKRPDGSDALDPTLALLKQTTLGRRHGQNSVLIRALSRIFAAWPDDDLDTSVLAELLSELGPELVLGRARDLSRSSSTSTEIAAARVITGEYDSRIGRSGKLGWQWLEPSDAKSPTQRRRTRQRQAVAA